MFGFGSSDLIEYVSSFSIDIISKAEANVETGNLTAEITTESSADISGDNSAEINTGNTAEA